MRPRFETSPGMGHGGGHAAESPRAPAVAALSREDIEGMIRKGVADGVAAVLGETQRLLQSLERRIDDLERRPTAAATAAAPAARSQPYAAAHTSAIPITHGSLAPPAPHARLLDVKAIEHDTSLTVDATLDGSKRKRNLAIVVTLLILVIFGGLFALLAQSYAPH